MRKGIYLILILLFPSIIYMIFTLGEHNVEKLSYYGQKEVVGEGDTIAAPVPNLLLKEAEGESFNLRDLSGKIIVLNVMDWPCEDPCLKKSVTLANYLVDVEKKEEWVIVSLCINPNVSERELASLASKHLAEDVAWRWTLSERPQQLQSFLNYVFVETEKLGSIRELPTTDYILLDRDQRIRGFFDSRFYKENKKLEDAIKLIIQEPYISWKEKKP